MRTSRRRIPCTSSQVAICATFLSWVRPERISSPITSTAAVQMRSSLIPLPYPDGMTKQARWNDDIVPDMFLPTRRETPMAEELIFYTNPMSRGQIARWMLEEVGAPYETRLLDYGTTMKAADYLAINQLGKVQIGRTPCRESVGQTE